MDNTEALSEDSKSKLQTALSLIYHSIRVGNSALQKFPEAYYAIQTFTFINYLERFRDALDAVSVLLKSFSEKPNLETSIGLTLRAALLDFLTVTFLTSFYVDINTDNSKGQEEFDSIINALNSDQALNTIRFIEVMLKNKFITREEFELAITKLHDNYNFLFNSLDLANPVASLKAKKHYSVKDMFHRINNHHLTTKFAGVYDLYMYYSKYEHFGMLTHFMQRHNLDTDLYRIIYSVSYLLRGTCSSLIFLNHPDLKVESEFLAMSELSEKFDTLWEGKLQMQEPNGS